MFWKITEKKKLGVEKSTWLILESFFVLTQQAYTNDS